MSAFPRALASARLALAPPCPPPACARFVRCFAAVSSSAPAARSAPPPPSPAAAGGRIPTSVFRSKLPSASEQLAEHHRLQRKNAALGAALFLSVSAIWAYSIWVTEDVKEKFTTPEVQQIEAELEKEDREAAQQQAGKKQ